MMMMMVVVVVAMVSRKASATRPSAFHRVAVLVVQLDSAPAVKPAPNPTEWPAVRGVG
jgi:hypothetical protein